MNIYPLRDASVSLWITRWKTRPRLQTARLMIPKDQARISSVFLKTETLSSVLHQNSGYCLVGVVDLVAGAVDLVAAGAAEVAGTMVATFTLSTFGMCFSIHGLPSCISEP